MPRPAIKGSLTSINMALKKRKLAFSVLKAGGSGWVGQPVHPAPR
jgi:hypothetical protein